MRRPRLSTTGTSWRRTSTLHYHTFPVQPPTSRGRPPSISHTPSTTGGGGDGSLGQADDGHDDLHGSSPLPMRQLVVLAIIALAEQTALNSISPYLPDMVSTFPGRDSSEVGLEVGIIASSFALAQFVTGFLWGWLSDRIGRKPVILVGTLLTAVCFVAFGFCKTLGQAIAVQALMGLVNGNQGVVSSCLGEITDRSNQSRAFIYLPVVYGVGAITGPMVGGLLASQHDPDGEQRGRYPYLLPNLVSAAILLIDVVVTMIYLEETLEEARNLPPLGQRLRGLFRWFWRTSSSKAASHLHVNFVGHQQGGAHEGGDRDVEEEGSDAAERDSLVAMPTMFPHQSVQLESREVFNKDTILLLVTYLIFQLCNISYNSLYPIFAAAPPPTGRALSPRVIGVSLAFAGVITILFQLGVFGRFRDALGNRATYRAAFALFAVSFLAMPFVGYKDAVHATNVTPGPTLWLWFELGLILLIKTIATVGGLTSALLMITNSAPNHNVLGALNGIAQTLSAAGRAIGPFVSGGLFSLATHVKPKGEALAWGVFGGIAFVGFGLSFGITNPALEAELDDDDEEDAKSDGHTSETDEHLYESTQESDALLPQARERAR